MISVARPWGQSHVCMLHMYAHQPYLEQGAGTWATHIAADQPDTAHLPCTVPGCPQARVGGWCRACGAAGGWP
jgi:hypothetical protein